MARELVIIDRAWPHTGLVREALLVASGVLLVGLGAHVEIPLQPVPITGQTLSVLLVGAVLGWRRGAITMAAYLLAGAMGLPVFAASGAPGLARFAGPTAGYLLSYPFAAALVGWLCERGWDRRFLTTFTAMLIGSIPVLTMGSMWLSRFVGVEAAIAMGVLPFLAGDVIKATLAACALPLAWKWLGRSTSSAD